MNFLAASDNLHVVSQIGNSVEKTSKHLNRQKLHSSDLVRYYRCIRTQCCLSLSCRECIYVNGVLLKQVSLELRFLLLEQRVIPVHLLSGFLTSRAGVRHVRVANFRGGANFGIVYLVLLTYVLHLMNALKLTYSKLEFHKFSGGGDKPSLLDPPLNTMNRAANCLTPALITRVNSASNNVSILRLL